MNVTFMFSMCILQMLVKITTKQTQLRKTNVQLTDQFLLQKYYSGFKKWITKFLPEILWSYSYLMFSNSLLTNYSKDVYKFVPKRALASQHL